jgi:hypothetical protein
VDGIAICSCPSRLERGGGVAQNVGRNLGATCVGEGAFTANAVRIWYVTQEILRPPGAVVTRSEVKPGHFRGLLQPGNTVSERIS